MSEVTLYEAEKLLAGKNQGIPVEHRGTSLRRKCPPPRTAVWPQAYAYLRVLGGAFFV